MNPFGDKAEPLLKELEHAMAQEAIATKKLKDYLYCVDKDETPLKDLFLTMQDVQAKKRQIHNKLRKVRGDIH